jgi:hypothetical protein
MLSTVLYFQRLCQHTDNCGTVNSASFDDKFRRFLLQVRLKVPPCYISMKFRFDLLVIIVLLQNYHRKQKENRRMYTPHRMLTIII